MESGGSGRRTTADNELVSPREFLQSWNVEALEAVHVPVEMSEEEIVESVAAKMGINDETVGELAEVCSMNSLMCGMEPKSKVRILEMKTAPRLAEERLESLRLHIIERERRLMNGSLRSAVSRRMKYNVMDEHLAIKPRDQMKPLDDPDYQVLLPNVVLTVQITKCLFQGEYGSKMRESETYHVLGTQTLADLRDAVRCSSDTYIAGDYSALPDTDSDTLSKAGDIYKSSFFFIEDVFYNDHRHPDNKDYSKPIVKWAEKEGKGKKYKTDRMEDKTFFDLKIRLGHHYLFMHQGSCEHSVLFSDLRLFTSEDVQDIRQYPVLTVARLRNRSVCQGCSKLSSKWIVEGAPVTPTDPCFLCKLCFKTLLYDKKGNKLANFKAHHFLDFCP